jgi:hypothetical protein
MRLCAQLDALPLQLSQSDVALRDRGVKAAGQSGGVEEDFMEADIRAG